MVTVTGQTSGSTARYTCNTGFELLDLTPGSDVRTCQDGTWSGSEAQCVGKNNNTCVALCKYFNPCMLLTGPVVTSVSGSGATQHAGEDYTLTCTVSGGETTATTTYQWRRDNTDMSGETSATLSFTPLMQTTPSSNGQYVCEAMRSGRTVRSNSITITVTGKLDQWTDASYIMFNFNVYK